MDKTSHYIEIGTIDKHDRSFIEWERVARAGSFDDLKEDLFLIAVSEIPDFVRIGTTLPNGKHFRGEYTGVEIAAMQHHLDLIIGELKEVERNGQ